MALSPVFHSINSPDNSPFSHAVLLVLFLPYWSFQLYISLWKSPSAPSPSGLTFTWWGCCGLCFWHQPTELAHSFSFCSCVYICLNDPFNCISFHKFSRQLPAFSLCSSSLISAFLVLSAVYLFMKVSFSPDITPQWGAADAEIKVPSGENTELKRSPFKAWSRSVYSHTCYAYCQGFLPC